MTNNAYHPPKYYDLSYSYDMKDELAFLKRIFREYATVGQPRLLEPACGTGRLMVPLINAGFRCAGFDINQQAIDYLKKNCGVTGWMRNAIAEIFQTSPSPAGSSMVPIVR